MARRSASPELTALAARLVVEEGLEYGPAKRRAARELGRNGRRDELPDNDELEDEVRAYLALFCADTQPAELRALRGVALAWMRRLPAFRPHLTGAAWRGTATRLSSVQIELYCDDPKSAEIELLNLGIGYDVASGSGPRGEPVDILVIDAPCPELGEPVTLCLKVLDADDLRGGLKPDARGRTDRGDDRALQRLLDSKDSHE
ncbi:MAG: hypothetical protein MUC74_15265 [Ideonella sp.]|nr:hypothetical protein [Ideonella sp.]